MSWYRSKETLLTLLIVALSVGLTLGVVIAVQVRLSGPMTAGPVGPGAVTPGAPQPPAGPPEQEADPAASVPLPAAAAAEVPSAPEPAVSARPATPKAAPAPNLNPLARGRELTTLLYDERLDQVWAAFLPSVRAEWGDLASFQAYRMSGVQAYGAETRVLQEQVTREGDVTYYTRTATFERGPNSGWTVIFGLNPQGQVQEFGIVGAELLPDLQAQTTP